MILRHTVDGIIVVNQPDHARLAGRLAEAWERPPDDPTSTITASHHHDDGWLEWEKQPTVDAEGRPHDFLTVPMRPRLEIYRRGIGMLSGTNLRAALLTSMHFTRLLAAGLRPLTGEDRRQAEGFLADQVAWENDTRRQLGEPAGAEPDYLVLRAMDFLSLLLCMRETGELSGTLLPAVHRGGDQATPLRLEVAEGTVRLDPWPFGAGALELTVASRALDCTKFSSDEDFRRALSAAGCQDLTFRLVQRPT